jgi:hypothetical protein
LSATELTRIASVLARALSIDNVHQIGLDRGQSERLCELNHQNDATVACKAFLQPAGEAWLR